MFDLPTSTLRQPLTLPHIGTELLPARSNDTAYQIFIRIPDSDPPAQGFPVVYLLDGDDLFVGAAELLRRTARRPESTGIAPAVIVGIGHAPNADNKARRRDYTSGPCATESVDAATGGAAAFLEFITDQLIPMIEADAKIDPARRGLLGHSLAGYFGLWTLATQAQPFSHVAAISPSIWWNPAALKAPSSATGANVYLAAGEWEDEPAPWQQKLAADPAGLERRKRRDMIGHTHDFADRLARQWPDKTVQFDLLAGEDHATVINPALTRALRFMQQTAG